MIRAVLTIDDIPSRVTPAIVDCLCARGITALMFAEGQRLEMYPDEAVYALQKGMIVGNHSWSHPHFSSLPYEEGVREIERCEEALDELYARAGVPRRFRPFRFPYGDKGGANKEAFGRHLKDHGFSKLRDDTILWPWWYEQGLDRDIDTFWTFDFMEYRIRPGSGFWGEDVFKRILDPAPAAGAPLLKDGGSHILLLHAHDETEKTLPGYYRLFIDALLEHGVVFDPPAFFD